MKTRNAALGVVAAGLAAALQAQEPPVPPGFTAPQPAPAGQPAVAPPGLPSLLAPSAPPPSAPTPAPVANPAGGKIQFDNAIYDFGRVRAGDPIKHTFYFTNVGEQVLELTSVRPSCGCTTAGDWTKRAEPGGSGSIPVQVNSANFNGAVVKMVTVTSSDKQQPTIALQLKGTIYKPIELAPAYTVIQIPPDAQTASAVVRIINNLDEPLTLAVPECNNRSFKAELVTRKEGKEFELTISTVPPFPMGSVSGQVSIKTSAASVPILAVPFMATVQQPVTVLPPQVTLPTGPLHKGTPAVITIQNNSTNHLTLSDPAVNISGVEVKLTEGQPGRFTVALSFPEGFEAKPGQQALFTVKSSNPRHPLIQVPIVQIARPAVLPAISKPPVAGTPLPPAVLPAVGSPPPAISAPVGNGSTPIVPLGTGSRPAAVSTPSPPGAPSAQ